LAIIYKADSLPWNKTAPDKIPAAILVTKNLKLLFKYFVRKFRVERKKYREKKGQARKL